ncbi:hypothetical protein QJQ45_018409 [Haematococcus lacustris]|nr:hypothetical protein QJQ45_018409 [Haematococcus lacustris]
MGSSRASSSEESVGPERIQHSIRAQERVTQAQKLRKHRLWHQRFPLRAPQSGTADTLCQQRSSAASTPEVDADSLAWGLGTDPVQPGQHDPPLAGKQWQGEGGAKAYSATSTSRGNADLKRLVRHRLWQDRYPAAQTPTHTGQATSSADPAVAVDSLQPLKHSPQPADATRISRQPVRPQPGASPASQATPRTPALQQLQQHQLWRHRIEGAKSLPSANPLHPVLPASPPDTEPDSPLMKNLQPAPPPSLGPTLESRHLQSAPIAHEHYRTTRAASNAAVVQLAQHYQLQAQQRPGHYLQPVLNSRGWTDVGSDSSAATSPWEGSPDASVSFTYPQQQPLQAVLQWQQHQRQDTAVGDNGAMATPPPLHMPTMPGQGLLPDPDSLTLPDGHSWQAGPASPPDHQVQSITTQLTALVDKLQAMQSSPAAVPPQPGAWSITVQATLSPQGGPLHLEVKGSGIALSTLTSQLQEPSSPAPSSLELEKLPAASLPSQARVLVLPPDPPQEPAGLGSALSPSGSQASALQPVLSPMPALGPTGSAAQAKVDTEATPSGTSDGSKPAEPVKLSAGARIRTHIASLLQQRAQPGQQAASQSHARATLDSDLAPHQPLQAQCADSHLVRPWLLGPRPGGRPMRGSCSCCFARLAAVTAHGSVLAQTSSLVQRALLSCVCCNAVVQGLTPEPPPVPSSAAHPPMQSLTTSQCVQPDVTVGAVLADQHQIGLAGSSPAHHRQHRLDESASHGVQSDIRHSTSGIDGHSHDLDSAKLPLLSVQVALAKLRAMSPQPTVAAQQQAMSGVHSRSMTVPHNPHQHPRLFSAQALDFQGSSKTASAGALHVKQSALTAEHERSEPATAAPLMSMSNSTAQWATSPAAAQPDMSALQGSQGSGLNSPASFRLTSAQGPDAGPDTPSVLRGVQMPAARPAPDLAPAATGGAHAWQVQGRATAHASHVLDMARELGSSLQLVEEDANSPSASWSRVVRHSPSPAHPAATNSSSSRAQADTTQQPMGQQGSAAQPPVNRKRSPGAHSSSTAGAAAQHRMSLSHVLAGLRSPSPLGRSRPVQSQPVVHDPSQLDPTKQLRDLGHGVSQGSSVSLGDGSSRRDSTAVPAARPGLLSGTTPAPVPSLPPAAAPAPLDYFQRAVSRSNAITHMLARPFMDLPHQQLHLQHTQPSLLTPPHTTPQRLDSDGTMSMIAPEPPVPQLPLPGWPSPAASTPSAAAAPLTQPEMRPAAAADRGSMTQLHYPSQATLGSQTAFTASSSASLQATEQGSRRSVSPGASARQPSVLVQDSTAADHRAGLHPHPRLPSSPPLPRPAGPSSPEVHVEVLSHSRSRSVSPLRLSAVLRGGPAAMQLQTEWESGLERLDGGAAGAGHSLDQQGGGSTPPSHQDSNGWAAMAATPPHRITPFGTHAWVTSPAPGPSPDLAATAFPLLTASTGSMDPASPDSPYQPTSAGWQHAATATTSGEGAASSFAHSGHSSSASDSSELGQQLLLPLPGLGVQSSCDSLHHWVPCCTTAQLTPQLNLASTTDTAALAYRPLTNMESQEAALERPAAQRAPGIAPPSDARHRQQQEYLTTPKPLAAQELARDDTGLSWESADDHSHSLRSGSSKAAPEPTSAITTVKAVAISAEKIKKAAEPSIAVCTPHEPGGSSAPAMCLGRTSSTLAKTGYEWHDTAPGGRSGRVFQPSPRPHTLPGPAAVAAQQLSVDIVVHAGQRLQPVPMPVTVQPAQAPSSRPVDDSDTARRRTSELLQSLKQINSVTLATWSRKQPTPQQR